jgi:sugar phosphate isomerase/epimerase
MLGISTSWRSEIVDSGLEIIRAILDLGLERVELEYRISLPMLQEILPLIRQRDITVISLHNYVPLPEGIRRMTANGESPSLSSLDRDERELALKYTRRTMEWAEEFEAKGVVLHLGKIPMESPMAVIKKLCDQGKIASADGQTFVAEQQKIRAGKSAAVMDAALRSLERLAKEAENRGLLLGVENRYNLHDVPNLEEFKTIFREFPGSSVRYWHDIGHATAQQNLGLANQEELLRLCGAFLVGVHLHGCKGHEDHKAPGAGEEDYGLLKKYLKAETIRVVETHHRASREELKKGLEFLREQEIF